MKTTKQMQAEKGTFWSLGQNNGTTLYKAMVDVVNTDGDGTEFYYPAIPMNGEYTHFLTTFSKKRVWMLRLGDYTNKKIMQAESDGTITIHVPVDSRDAELQNMWLSYVGVPWRIKFTQHAGWFLADASGEVAAKFGGTKANPFIKVYAVTGEGPIL